MKQRLRTYLWKGVVNWWFNERHFKRWPTPYKAGYDRIREGDFLFVSFPEMNSHEFAMVIYNPRPSIGRKLPQGFMVKHTCGGIEEIPDLSHATIVGNRDRDYQMWGEYAKGEFTIMRSRSPDTEYDIS